MGNIKGITEVLRVAAFCYPLQEYDGCVAVKDVMGCIINVNV